MQKVSQRAEDLINTPLYSVKKEELDESEDKLFVYKKDGVEFYLNIELSNLNKIINIKYNSNIIGIDVAIIESCFKMLEKRTVDRLYSTNFREAESFLRDDNHVPSIPEGIDSEWIFEMLKKVAAFLLVSSLRDLPNIQISNEMSLVQKIKHINALLENFSLESFVIGQFVTIGLIQLEAKKLEVSISPKQMAIVALFEKDILETLSGYISSLLGEEINAIKYE